MRNPRSTLIATCLASLLLAGCLFVHDDECESDDDCDWPRMCESGECRGESDPYGGGGGGGGGGRPPGEGDFAASTDELELSDTTCEEPCEDGCCTPDGALCCGPPSCDDSCADSPCCR